MSTENPGSTDDLAGWTPIRVSNGAHGLLVDWCFTEGVAFDDPFFDQTVERCLRHPFRLLFRRTTSIDVLGELVARGGARAPSGLVLHLSRSGSTLVAQMFAKRGDTHVVSEAGPLDTVMRAPAAADLRAQWLRWTAAALRRPGADRPYYVLKLDAWAVLELPLLRQAFPGVPWVFVYRDPVEVLVSQERHRGFHMMPSGLPPAAVGFDADQVASMSMTEYGAAVLGRIASAGAAAADDPLGLLVNYDELPTAVERIAAHFGIPVDERARTAMTSAAGRDVKNGVLPFADDRAAKQRAAGDELRSAVDRWVAQPYRQLECIRVGMR